MSLREDQVVRYSRQILLPRVGGRGQERLLALGVRVLPEAASGPGSRALAVAVSYLAAGGTPVRTATLPGERADVGFALESEPEDGVSRWGQLGAAGARYEGPGGGEEDGPWVGLTASGRCVLRSEQGCADCFRATLAQPEARPLDGAGSALCAPLLGAWAALVFQREALGWENAGGAPGLRAWQLDAGGLMQAADTQPCARCRA